MLYFSSYQRTIFQLLRSKTYAWVSFLLYRLHQRCSLFKISKSFIRMFEWIHWAIFWRKKFLQRKIIFLCYSKETPLHWLLLGKTSVRVLSLKAWLQEEWLLPKQKVGKRENFFYFFSSGSVKLLTSVVTDT